MAKHYRLPVLLYLRKLITRQQWSLRYVLVLCIAGFQFFTVMAVVLFVYFAMDRTILQKSEVLLDQHSEVSVERVSNFILPSIQLSEMLVKFVESGMTDLTQNATLERIFYGALRTSPEISGLYFGRMDGTFIYVFQTEGTTQLTTKLIDQQGQGATYLVRDEGYLPVERHWDESDDYDPRKRPWYTSVSEIGQPTWTDVYTFYTSGEQGMTFAAPVSRDNQLQGVFGIDIEIRKLGEILGNPDHNMDLTTSLFTKTGEAIVHLSGSEMSEIDTIFDLPGYGGAIVRSLFSDYSATPKGYSTQFPRGSQVGQKELVLANIQSLDDHGLPWLIATHATREALTGGMLENQSRTMWMASLLLGFLSLFAIPLADRIRKPVLHFAQQSKDIVQGYAHMVPQGALKVPYSELETTSKALLGEISKRRNFEVQYDRTFNRSQRGMAHIDPISMKFLRVNERFCEMLGKSESALLNSGLDTALSGDKQRILIEFRDAVMNDKDFTTEVDFSTDGNPVVPLRMTAFLMRDLDGNPDHAFSLFDNNEESKQSAARLENFKRDLDRIGRINLMGQFAAGLAHELNQPLGALVHDVDSAKLVLNEQDVDHFELEEILKGIDGHAHRAGDIIRALRNMIQHDDQIPHCFQLNDLLEQTLAIMKPEAVEYDVHFETKVRDNYIIQGNRVQIAQVLVNLIRNAISALSTCDPGHRLICLHAYENEKGVVISIEDNGPGFSSHIKPFAQFETTSPGGLGLGLSISKSLVEANKGAICHIKGNGHGARFEITLLGRASKRGDELNERRTDDICS
jgi:signal transduction histidine kinase